MSLVLAHRPRNVDWKRAAALLYGDWGTSKAYVIGAAFLACGYASLSTILAVSALTGLVAYNYVIICKHFPDGGGVYSSARSQSRLLAVVGSLLLVADLTVTASLSGWSAMAYFQIPKSAIVLTTVGVILVVGVVNVFGPKHSGSMAVALAVPTVVVVVAIVLLSFSHLSFAHVQHSRQSWARNWTGFVGVILALSGVEAIANLTGVMRLDEGATIEAPMVVATARKAIVLVALEVVFGTALLGWGMLSLPPVLQGDLLAHWDDMLMELAVQYGKLAFGVPFAKAFGFVTAGVIGLLLLSAVNTAVVALVGLLYLLARDGEMPEGFARLNRFGVPRLPLLIAVVLPVVVVLCSPDQISLMELYAIGVVGAITVNLGSSVFNKGLKLVWHERGIMAATAAVLLAVELTLAKTKPNALFFITCILIVGLSLRGYAQTRAGMKTLTVRGEIADALISAARLQLRVELQPGQSIMVAARGITPVLRYAAEEARLRQGPLYVLYVKTLAVSTPESLSGVEPARWQTDRQAAEIMYGMLELGKEIDVQILPIYAVADDPAFTIVDLAATLGIDILMLGSPNRNSLLHLLKGNVVAEVARCLPENIQLVIHG